MPLSVHHVLANMFNHDFFNEYAKNKQLTIYGWKHCFYQEIATTLQHNHLKIFTNTVGIRKIFPSKSALELWEFSRTTLENQKIDHITFKSEGKKIKRQCKAGLVNLILENYKRSKEGLSLIKTVFVIDFEGNPYPESNKPSNICSKEKDFNERVTNKELRRAYRLYHEYNGKLNNVASKTFEFVKLVNDSQKLLIFEPIQAPWNDPDWKICWEKRISNRIAKKNPAASDWRNQLETKISYYDAFGRTPVEPTYQKDTSSS